MYKYRINLSWSDDDQAWIASVPELPGCLSDGVTPEEAIDQAQVIIREWIETAQLLGRPIPQPQPFI